jgi:uncharacterized protein (TIGR02246 family)
MGVSGAKEPPVMSTETARNAHGIETILETYETALNRNDVETILGLYGDTPVFMPQHAPALIGRDAVRTAYRQVFDTIKLSVRFDVHEVQEAGDWAWARTSSAGRTRILASGAEIAEGNNELFVLRREKGAWKIHRYLFSTNQPPRV